MHITSIATAAAIAVAAGIGTAGAGEDFKILRGVDATPISDLESARTRGASSLNRPPERGDINEVPIDLGALLPISSEAIVDTGGGTVTINGVIRVDP